MTSGAQDYVNEWASRTGRAPSDVYVPLALREPKPSVPPTADPEDVALSDWVNEQEAPQA